LHPQIEILGVVVAEPTTIVTDYVVAVVSVWFATRLIFSEHSRRHACRQWWATGFLFIGLGLILGGTAHGFAPYLSVSAMSMIWKLAYYVAGLAMASLVAGTVVGSVPARNLRRVLHGLNGLGLLIFATWVTISDDNFVWVIIVTVVSLGGVALIQIWAFALQKSKSAKWLISGVLLYFLSAVIQQSNIDLHPNLNHNDLYHIVLMAGLYFLFRGAKLLQDQS